MDVIRRLIRKNAQVIMEFFFSDIRRPGLSSYQKHNQIFHRDFRTKHLIRKMRKEEDVTVTTKTKVRICGLKSENHRT
jgi:hypothetical protein